MLLPSGWGGPTWNLYLPTSMRRTRWNRRRSTRSCCAMGWSRSTKYGGLEGWPRLFERGVHRCQNFEPQGHRGTQGKEHRATHSKGRTDEESKDGIVSGVDGDRDAGGTWSSEPGRVPGSIDDRRCRIGQGAVGGARAPGAADSAGSGGGDSVADGNGAGLLAGA